MLSVQSFSFYEQVYHLYAKFKIHGIWNHSSQNFHGIQVSSFFVLCAKKQVPQIVPEARQWSGSWVTPIDSDFELRAFCSWFSDKLWKTWFSVLFSVWLEKPSPRLPNWHNRKELRSGLTIVPLLFQRPRATRRNTIGHCAVSKTQEKPTHLTAKCFVPENDFKIIHIFVFLLSPAKPRDFGMMSHSRVTFTGQRIERSSVNEEATQGPWRVNIRPRADWFL